MHCREDSSEFFSSLQLAISKPLIKIHSNIKSFPIESYHRYKYLISFVDDNLSFAWISVGEVRFGSVFAHFLQTANQMVRFLTGILKPKPKPIETVYNGSVRFKLGSRRFRT